MILDKTWNKKDRKLIVSYIDKQGNRKFWQKHLHHIKTYEYDTNGAYDTWNGKKCNKIFKDTTNYAPNQFDELELFYELPDEIKSQFYAQNFPKVYAMDIETEIDNKKFPDPDKAEQRVTAISLVGPDLSCIVYGLHKLDSDRVALFKKRYLDWLNNNEFATSLLKKNNWQPKVLYQSFDTEENLLEHFFTVIIKKISVLIGWNMYGFDMTYLTNRVINLFGKGAAYNMFRQSSPTGEIRNYTWKDMAQNTHRFVGPCHSIIIDYMEVVKTYDYILRPYESYSLDYVGNRAVNAHKIKYEGTLQDLYEKDPEWYYFYNAVDSLITILIHYKLKSLESPCAVSSLTLVPLLDAFGQIALTTANVFKEFYDDNKHVVYDFDEIARVKVPYEGAFVGCVPGRFMYVVCDDFASLYPSQVQSCNFSFENFYQKKIGPDSLGRYVVVPWTAEELEEFKKDKNYFVSVNGNVYKNDKDYAFKRMQRRTKKNRDVYKYTGQRIESELLVCINDTLNNIESNVKFSKDIIKLLKEHFPNIDDPINDIRNMSNEELESIKKEVIDLRHEYELIELGCKVLGNGAYGSCASPYFYFFNPALAGDITAECRELTKTMWNDLEYFFHETLWERKDLWTQFEFELDESKHEWYRTQPVSVYSDTDSVYTTYGTLFNCMTPESQNKYDTPEKKIRWILKFNKEFLDKQNTTWCENIYNPRHGHNIHEFELETISFSNINLKKKKYLKALSFKKGVFYDPPKIAGTGIEIIKSTTPKLCRKILTELTKMLLFDLSDNNKDEFILAFNERIREYKKEFYKASYDDISQSVGVGDYNKFVVEDKDMLCLGKGCPVSVHSVARFNYLAHKNNDDSKMFYSGKIKYYNIRLSKKEWGFFGYPIGELPTWRPEMDKLKQWEKTVIDPINRFLEVMDIPLLSPDLVQQLSLF